MSQRGRKREVRDGVPHFLTSRGANDPFEFLSGVGVLIENCKQKNALGFRHADGLSIGEGLEKLREARLAVEAAGTTYIEAGGSANRDAWHFAMGEWVGYLEETTMLNA